MTTPALGQLAYTAPLSADGEEEPARRSVVVLGSSGTGAGLRLEVAFVSFDLELASPTWCAVLEEEAGLSSAVCVLTDSVTEVRPDVVSDAYGQLRPDALELVAAARDGRAPADRVGPPIFAPALDPRTVVEERFRLLRAALERASDDLALAPSSAPVPIATLSRLGALTSLGLRGAFADDRAAKELWMPSGPTAGLALHFDPARRSLTLKPSTDADDDLAVITIVGLGRVYVPLATVANRRTGRARLHEVGEALASVTDLEVQLQWLADASALADADPRDLRISARAASEFYGALQRWRDIVAALPEGPARDALSGELGAP